MRVTPLPGADGEQLQKTLREQHTAVYNIWSGHQGPAQGWLDAYLEWATNAVQHLGRQISRTDLDQLVLTPGYERLLSVAGRLTSFEIGTQRVLNGMVSLELQQRVSAFEAAIKELDEQIHRWSPLGAFLVADTTVFIEHEDKLEKLDIAALADAQDDLAPVHLLVPIVVVDELTGSRTRPTSHTSAGGLATPSPSSTGSSPTGLDRQCSGPGRLPQVLRCLAAPRLQPRSCLTRPDMSGCQSTTTSWLTERSLFRLLPDAP